MVNWWSVLIGSLVDWLAIEWFNKQIYIQSVSRPLVPSSFPHYLWLAEQKLQTQYVSGLTYCRG